MNSSHFSYWILAVSLSFSSLLSAQDSEQVHMANGIKIGEVT